MCETEYELLDKSNSSFQRGADILNWLLLYGVLMFFDV